MDAVQTSHSIKENIWLGVHFSQFGEDILLWHYFHNKKNGFYVDVGCHHPFRYSNTALLHTALGWHGVNIDADPRAIENFKVHRPNDININVGVGIQEELREFSLFADGAVNTFDKSIADNQASNFTLEQTFTLKVRPLSAILSEVIEPGTPIDYMDIDCEGLDYEVLQSNDWEKFRPLILSVEVHGMNLENPQDNEIFQFMKSKGYFMKSHYTTSIFQRF